METRMFSIGRFLRISVVLCVLLASSFALSACAAEAGEDSSSSEHYADDSFLQAVSDGLEARWGVEEVFYVDGSDEHREYFEKLVDAELSYVESYAGEKFEDSVLQEKALKYINCLKQQKESLDYLKADYSRFDGMWEEAYDLRTQLIVGFVDDYGLTVSDEYASTLKEFKTNAALVSKKQDQEAAVKKICESMAFEAVGDGDYIAVVENASDYAFKNFSVNVNLLDADGVILESTYAGVEHWDKGQKAQFKIYAYGIDFADVSVTADYWTAE